MSNVDLQNRRLREFLMTTFLVIVVFEIIAKPFIWWAYYSIMKCDLLWSQILCQSLQYIPEYGFSTFNWADSNLVIIIWSLIFTWFFIWLVYKIANFFYAYRPIKKYMKSWWRKDLHTDDFWAILLLSFFLCSIIICILYPFLGLVVLMLTVYTILEHRKWS